MFALRRKPPPEIEMLDPIPSRMAALQSSVLSGGRTLARSGRKRARQSRALSRRSIDHEIPLIPLLFPMF